MTPDVVARARLTDEDRARADEAALARLPGLFLAWDTLVEGSTSPVDHAFNLIEVADHMTLLRSAWRDEPVDPYEAR